MTIGYEARRCATWASTGPRTEEIKDVTLDLGRASLEEHAFAEAWSRGRTLTADEAVELALGELS